MKGWPTERESEERAASVRLGETERRERQSEDRGEGERQSEDRGEGKDRVKTEEKGKTE